MVFLSKALLVAPGVVGGYMAGKAKDRTWLQSFVILNMLFIPFFGARMVELGPLVSNVGNFFYSFALMGLLLLTYKDGIVNAYHIIRRMLVIFAYTFLTMQILENLPAVEGNETIALAQDTLFVPGGSIIVASLVALSIATTFAVWLTKSLSKIHHVLNYLIVVTLAQIVDSIIFFPIAFGGQLPLEVVINIMIDGFLIKAGIAIITLPVVYTLLKDKR